MKVKYAVLGSVPALAGILFMIFIALDAMVVEGFFLNGTNEKYQVAQDLKMSEDDLKKATYAMVEYVEGKRNSPQVMVVSEGKKTSFFTPKEILHLKDVRELLVNFRIFFRISFLVCLVGSIGFIWKKKIKELCVGTWIAWGILFLLGLMVGAMAFIDINLVVYGFHKLFFDNDLWLLSLSKHRSIWMFQNKIYVDFLAWIGGIMLTILGITMIGSFMAYKKVTRKTVTFTSRNITNEKE